MRYNMTTVMPFTNTIVIWEEAMLANNTHYSLYNIGNYGANMVCLAPTEQWQRLFLYCRVRDLRD